MIDDELKNQILDSITKSGKVEESTIMVNTNINSVLSLSNGSPRLHPTITRKAALILSQPKALSSLSSLQIRCVLCKRVISYPCWYYNIRYAVNHFHYFICFDTESINKPSTRCYRRN